jgi:thioredoxin reductase (NADPH)
VTAINGEGGVASISVQNVKTKAEQEIAVDGLFVFIGQDPQAAPFNKFIPTDPQGFLLADENTATELAGVFVAGDIRSKDFRQIATAASDGVVAARMAVRFLQETLLK